MQTENVSNDVIQRVFDLLADLDLGRPSEVVAIRSLTGGIASDVAQVETANHNLCVKFALPKLRVEADWFAPIHRNRTEFLWLKLASTIAPENTPRLYGHSERVGGFAMEYVGGPDSYVWKSVLFKRPPDIGIARSIGRLLGRLHAVSARPDFDASQFPTKDVFYSMRVEPYILYTASHHVDLANRLHEMAKSLENAEVALVHGDVSPKNILVNGDKIVLVDAECASMGDPAFDVAFCLNHFFLKAVFGPQFKSGLFEAAKQFWQCYLAVVDWEDRDQIGSRTAVLLPALALARVDGKSPVEYFDKRHQEFVRELARSFIQSPASRVETLLAEMFALVSGPQ